MRRVFIIRKDLHLSPGKLAAMVGHCAEAYWTNLLKAVPEHQKLVFDDGICLRVDIDKNIWDNYINDRFVKTICEAKDIKQLKKVENIIQQYNFKEGEDWGYINDCCLTELKPENADGTTTIGVWFKPLNDEIAHQISKKYKLYGIFDKKPTTVYALYQGSYRSFDESNSTLLARYSTLAEAKKHMLAYYEKYVKSDDVLSKHTKIISDTQIDYSDGYKWSYDLVIQEEELNVKEHFDEADL